MCVDAIALEEAVATYLLATKSFDGDLAAEQTRELQSFVSSMDSDFSDPSSGDSDAQLQAFVSSMDFSDPSSGDSDALNRYQDALDARTYGGNFAWTGTAYTLAINRAPKVVSLLHSMNRLANKFVLGGSLVFVADGSFRRPGECASLFPIGIIDLRWRYDKARSCIVIDFFRKGEVIPWRFDELRPVAESYCSSEVPALEGIGHVGKRTFTYTMRSMMADMIADSRVV